MDILEYCFEILFVRINNNLGAVNQAEAYLSAAAALKPIAYGENGYRRFCDLL